ncbi:hypothetical protein D6745_00550 [Candidatus Woesearchaeota archaeon]|nr:MAG: hypothetical protein D6745_00550 [Candidatus Woesearchaeota archaeon]
MVITKTGAIIIVLFCAFLGAGGQIFFKLASENLNFNIISWLTNYKLIIGLFLYGIATVLFVYTLKFGEVSLLYPIIATSYIWVSIFAVLFLGEHMSIYKWLGILMIISGVSLVIK